MPVAMAYPASRRSAYVDDHRRVSSASNAATHELFVPGVAVVCPLMAYDPSGWTATPVARSR
jgi:hypothetical protein